MIHCRLTSLNLDAIGCCASLLCAIHCAGLPLMLSLAPLAGLHFREDARLEYTLIGISLIVAILAVVQGYRRHHQQTVGWIVLGGFMLLLAGHSPLPAWAERMEVVFTVLGAATVAVAHVVNRKLVRQTRRHQ